MLVLTAEDSTVGDLDHCSRDDYQAEPLVRVVVLITQIEHATLMVMSFQHWYAEQSDALMSEHPAP